jgi:RNA polymerase sigma-70 factor, ECF subfamily
MAARIEEAKLTGFPACISRREAQVRDYRESFEASRHRIYSLAFWMTGSEPAAQELAVSTFCRAFTLGPSSDAENLDRAFVAELREITPLGSCTLQCDPCSSAARLGRNIKRVELECALVQLPPTERLIFLLHDVEGYDHARIGRLLGFGGQESACGLHQARLRLRELLTTIM